MTISGIAPGKIIAVHLNYPSRAAQRGRTPAQPSYFLKPSSSLAASGDTLERPAGTELLAFEGEIALVIGEPARRVSPDDGWKHVASVTAANDFGLYDLRAADKGSNVRSKGGDGFTPLGPHLIDAASVDPAALRVRTWVNGELVQEDTSDTLLFPFGRLVADLSQLLTLETGDVILTGTPAGSSVVVPGDVVEVEVDAPDAAGAPSSGRLVDDDHRGHRRRSATTARSPRSTTSSASRRGATRELRRRRRRSSRRAASARDRPRSSSPTSCATCSAPSASRPSASQLRKRGYTRRLHRGRARQPRRAPASSAGPAPCGSSRSGPTCSRATAAASTRRSCAFDTVEPRRGARHRGPRRARHGHGRRRARAARPGARRRRHRHRRRRPRLRRGRRARHPHVLAGPAPLGARPPARAVGGRRHDRVRRRGGAARRRDRGRRRRRHRDPAATSRGRSPREAAVQEAEDAWVAEQVAAGASVDGLFPMNAEWRARYEARDRRRRGSR